MNWRPFLLTQIPCGLFTFACALLLDNSLRQFGINIHPWKEAMISALAGVFFSSLLVPILWRLGLVTMPQYILGAIGLFVPATLLSLIAVSWFEPIVIELVNIQAENTEGGALAIALYIRIARSAVLFPCYIFMFWLVYHKLLKRTHL